MKYAVEMASFGMIYIPSFIKIGSGILKLLGENSYGHRHTRRSFHKPNFIFSK
jgi:hypothetical protein